MQKIFIIILALNFWAKANAQNGRLVSECTVQYAIAVEGGAADDDFSKTMQGATKTVYIKGTRSRTDLVSPTYTQTILNDTKSDTTIVLRELGNAKYLSYLTPEKRRSQNKRWEGLTFSPAEETKTILGYECKKMIASSPNGASFNVWYAPAIIPSTKEFEYQFKDIPGFVLEYETQAENGKATIKYSATKITLMPVPASRFDVPKTGYRVI